MRITSRIYALKNKAVKSYERHLLFFKIDFNSFKNSLSQRKSVSN